MSQLRSLVALVTMLALVHASEATGCYSYCSYTGTKSCSVDNYDRLVCVCKEGYTGNKCQTPIDQ